MINIEPNSTVISPDDLRITYNTLFDLVQLAMNPKKSDLHIDSEDKLQALLILAKTDEKEAARLNRVLELSAAASTIHRLIKEKGLI